VYAPPVFLTIRLPFTVAVFTDFSLTFNGLEFSNRSGVGFSVEVRVRVRVNPNPNNNTHLPTLTLTLTLTVVRWQFCL
jgi:hypothetical protein